MRDAPFLLARVHLPFERATPFLYRRFGDNVGAMDGSIFSFQRAGEPVNAYAWWETLTPEVIGRGRHGVIRIVPKTPDFWTHLKPGTSLAMTPEDLHAQVTQSLMENQA
ncbi:hypothetical protein LAJ19_03140 [Deinococcus taeanensis]|uniref:hypothetical protein n=1 Tax=Deinococcus taeanensis TaxID=2737050 RepID=UPI001CDBE23C|nr:hypothetical protein [Deinococcus taeanensis]UBV43226.1 hypothetical protein LAJ19_03140 [Deinococcus taeanensis]